MFIMSAKALKRRRERSFKRDDKTKTDTIIWQLKRLLGKGNFEYVSFHCTELPSNRDKLFDYLRKKGYFIELVKYGNVLECVHIYLDEPKELTE